jgi:transposase-like protein
MIDFPIDELLDDEACLMWLERHLHPAGFACPRCGASERRLARRRGAFPSYRCRHCDRYHTILTGTAFQKTHQTPGTLVLLLRGIAKGESTARLGRELSVSRRQMGTLRQRVQQNLADTLPRAVSEEAIFEADELYQNAGEKRHPASRPRRSPPTSGQ